MAADAGALALVDRRLPEPLLRDLLEAALEVLVAGGRRQGAIAVEVVVIGGVVAGVEEHRAEHGLERVGQQRLQVSAATLRDALAEVEVAAQVELLGKLGQRVRVDHRRAGLRKLALGRSGMVLVQVLGADELQHRVAEVLEPLVVAGRQLRVLVGERAVRDGFVQQAGVAKVDPDLLLQKLQGLIERCSLLCYEPAFSWMYSQACPTVVIFSASSSGISSPVFSSKA